MPRHQAWRDNPSSRGLLPVRQALCSTVRRELIAAYWRPQQSDWHPPRSPRPRPGQPRCTRPQHARKHCGRSRYCGTAHCEPVKTPSDPGSCLQSRAHKTSDRQGSLSHHGTAPAPIESQTRSGHNGLSFLGRRRICQIAMRPTSTFTSPRDGRARTRYISKSTEVPMRFNPIANEFAAVVEGIDLCAPLNSAQVATIDAGMDRHAVLVFHDQPLTDEQQIAFTRSLGKIELNTANNITRLDQRRLSIEMSDISNLDQHSNILARDDRRRAFNLGNRLWHSDSSFKAVPAKYSLLSAPIIPSAGGNTEFADMRAAYDALDPEIKAEVEDLIAEHSLLFSRGQLGFTEFTAEERVKFAPVRHRLVRTNPTTGRKSLFLSSHIGGIVGWPVPEAMAFVRDLVEHATQRQFVYAHTWRQHHLVMWDNRQTVHRARPYTETSEVRDMRRTTLEGDGPTTLQMAVA